MVSIAIKLLSVVVGIWAAFASYPWLNLHVLAALAVLAAAAVGILAAALFYAVATWVFAEVSDRTRP